MSKEWTPERRAAQSERIRALKPWLKSTGPKTRSGKKRSSLNALKHGERTLLAQQAAKALKLHQQFMKEIKIAFSNPGFDAALCAAQTNYIKKLSETGA